MTQENQQSPEYVALLANLKDPAYVRALAAQHGLHVDTGGSPGEAGTLSAPKPPEIPEGDVDNATIAKLFADYTAQLQDYHAKLLEEKIAATKKEVTEKIESKEKIELGNKVRAFAKEHSDFQELLDVIDPLYASGRYTLEEAYSLAKKAKSKVEEQKPATMPPVSSTTSSVKLGDSTVQTPLEKTNRPTKDIIASKLDALLKERPEVTLSEEPKG